MNYLLFCQKPINKDPIYEPERPNEVKKAICSSNKARDLLAYNTRDS